MALLPPPDIGAAYVDEEKRPSKDFYNWIKSLYDYTRGITTGVGSGVPGGSVSQVQYNAGAGNFGGYTNGQVTALLDLFTAAPKGVVSASGGGTTNFLRADGSWAVPPGTGGGGGGALSVQLGPVGNPNSNVETTLLSYTLPANTVTVIGTGLTIKAAGYWGSAARIATIRLKFGSEVLTLNNPATDGSRWNAEMSVILTATGPTKQFVTAQGNMNTGGLQFGSNPTINMTSTVGIEVTGQSNSPAAPANDAVCYQLIVEPLG